jgi:hypothetical protein
MTTRKVKFKPTSNIEPCPKCGNKLEFTIKSDYCAEDCCDVWAECKCGHEPKDARFEDVWGGCNDDNCYAAIECWNDAIRVFNELSPEEKERLVEKEKRDEEAYQKYLQEQSYDQTYPHK